MSGNVDMRTCLLCNQPLKGRTDKKYCDDYCRNAYNNQQKAKTVNNYIKNINNALLKNRRILESILSDNGETIKTPKERLHWQGFQFKYSTHSLTTPTGQTCFYCYEYGYVNLDNEWCLVVKATNP
jgi:hypothetical protein